MNKKIFLISILLFLLFNSTISFASNGYTIDSEDYAESKVELRKDLDGTGLKAISFDVTTSKAPKGTKYIYTNRERYIDIFDINLPDYMCTIPKYEGDKDNRLIELTFTDSDFRKLTKNYDGTDYEGTFFLDADAIYSRVTDPVLREKLINEGFKIGIRTRIELRELQDDGTYKTFCDSSDYQVIRDTMISYGYGLADLASFFPSGYEKIPSLGDLFLDSFKAYDKDKNSAKVEDKGLVTPGHTYSLAANLGNTYYYTFNDHAMIVKAVGMKGDKVVSPIELKVNVSESIRVEKIDSGTYKIFIKEISSAKEHNDRFYKDFPAWFEGINSILFTVPKDIDINKVEVSMELGKAVINGSEEVDTYNNKVVMNFPVSVTNDLFLEGPVKAYEMEQNYKKSEKMNKGSTYSIATIIGNTYLESFTNHGFTITAVAMKNKNVVSPLDLKINVNKKAKLVENESKQYKITIPEIAGAKSIDERFYADFPTAFEGVNSVFLTVPKNLDFNKVVITMELDKAVVKGVTETNTVNNRIETTFNIEGSGDELLPDDLSLSNLKVQQSNGKENPDKLLENKFTVMKFDINNTFTIAKKNNVQYEVFALNNKKEAIGKILSQTVPNISIPVGKTEYPKGFGKNEIAFNTPSAASAKYIEIVAKLDVLPEESDDTNNELSQRYIFEIIREEGDLSLSNLKIKQDGGTYNPSQLVRGKSTSVWFDISSTFSDTMDDNVKYEINTLNSNKAKIGTLVTLPSASILIPKGTNEFPTKFGEDEIIFTVPNDLNVRYISISAKVDAIPGEKDTKNNELSSQKYIFEIQDINLKANKYVGDERFNISQTELDIGINVTNVSGMDYSAVNFRADLYKIGGSGAPVSSKTFASPISKLSTKDYTTRISSPQVVGHYKLKITVDSDNKIAESNESDNTIEKDIYIGNDTGNKDLIAISLGGRTTIWTNEGVFETILKVNSNYSSDIANVRFAVKFGNNVYLFERTVLRGTNDYSFYIPCDKSVGIYPLKVTVNATIDNPIEDRYDNNSKENSIRVIDQPAPPPSVGESWFDFSAFILTDNNSKENRITTKSGYGIPVIAEIMRFNYVATMPNSLGFSSLNYSPEISYTTNLELPSHMNPNVILVADSSSLEFPKTYRLTQNSYSKFGKRNIYTNPNLSDGTYDIIVTLKASGSYIEYYQVYEIVGYYPPPSISPEMMEELGITSLPPPVPIYDWVIHQTTVPFNYTESVTLKVTIRGSMYDDDSVIINQ